MTVVHGLKSQVSEGSFPGVNRPKREADQSPLSNAEVSNAWSFIPTPPHISIAWCLSTESNLPLTSKRIACMAGCYGHSYTITTTQFTVQLSLLVLWQHWSNESWVRLANTIIILLGSYSNAGGFQSAPVLRSFYPASTVATHLSWRYRNHQLLHAFTTEMMIRASWEASSHHLKCKGLHLFLKTEPLLREITAKSYGYGI